MGTCSVATVVTVQEVVVWLKEERWDGKTWEEREKGTVRTGRHLGFWKVPMGAPGWALCWFPSAPDRAA